MSATRFNYTAARTAKNLQESTGPGRYMIDVPGNGLKPCYMVDPSVRLQKWGANLMTNPVDLESALMGIDQRLGIRDCHSSENPIKDSGSKVAPTWALLPSNRVPHIPHGKYATHSRSNSTFCNDPQAIPAFPLGQM